MDESRKKAGSDHFNIFDLKNYDVYTKVEEDFVIQTSGGATLSLIGWVVIALLVIGELGTYFSGTTREHMVVDTTLGERLRINIDITFHSLTCREVNVDVMDVAGDNQVAIDHDMFKQRLDKNGKLLGEKAAEIIGKLDEVPALPPNYCGSCFGAESLFRECCNTCDEIKMAYNQKGWAYTDALQNSEQCLREKESPFSAVRNGEGCRVHGSMSVNKVAGNFHIAHGESIIRDGRHIHQFIPGEAPQFNISHTINSLSFGVPYPSMPPNPMDGNQRLVGEDTGTGLYQYFIKVIPTVYRSSYDGISITTNQYTVSEKFKPLTSKDEHGQPVQVTLLPGIFFIFDISPFMIQISNSSMPFYHLMTRLFAIVGGVFSVLGILDAILYRIQKFAAKKD
jgi:hypothetical protein